MKKRFVIVLLTLLVVLHTYAGGNNENTTVGEGKTIVDMAGRTVIVPNEITTVFSTNPIGTIFLYTLAPEKLVAWNFAPNEAEKEFIAEEYQNLPAFGQDARVNYEAVLSVNPDIIIVYFQTISDKLYSDIENLETTLAKPVIAIKGQLVDADATYEFLGELLDVKTEAHKRADYVRGIFDKAISSENKARVYFGDGIASLDTIPKGSPSSQELDLASVENVSEVSFGSESRVSVSPEQIIAWNPDIVLVNGEPKEGVSQYKAVEDFLANPVYKDLKAVQEHRVYGVPKTPFSWVGRPIGVNRLIGVQWISHLAYGGSDLDFEKTVKEFYELFYHVSLTDEDIEKLLNTK